MRCLLIEDDLATAELVRHGLERAGHVVQACHEGDTGLRLALDGSWDVLVLDRMLPGGVDGLGVLAALRSHGIATPVIVLSALSSLDERVRGLRSGGDDYLGKPFAFDELLARIEALARRAVQRSEPDVIEIGDLRVDTRNRRVHRGTQAITLQPREYQLLEYLARHQGMVVTRRMLLTAVWGYHFDPETNVIDVQISRLRNKLDRDFPTPLIHTARGVGYTLRAE
ncbi:MULTISPECIES: response regulator transcription factor [Rhodanobacter]|uniref:response regulator transcription factor n=1 Tax=Rhodanobacter TaxID=75309 RepID=UPI00040CC45D|nr:MULTISPECIES: response regulator transcription factor [Rhodanobacter]TAN18622.1 MAG: response regulator transcription factor [Rhodanobacter sp.]UJJ56378.1 response regulator transcription factor [Rhodanobacter thiooxydans]